MTFSPEDFSPALRPGARSMYVYVATAKGGVCQQKKLPRFPGAVTEVYIIAEASAVNPRCRRDTCRRQPDGAPPAGTTRGLHLDRVGEKKQGWVERRGVRWWVTLLLSEEKTKKKVHDYCVRGKNKMLSDGQVECG